MTARRVGTWMQRLLCWFSGHQWAVWQQFTSGVPSGRYTACDRCGRKKD